MAGEDGKDVGEQHPAEPAGSAPPAEPAPHAVDEQVEEEPRLKYKRLGSSVPELLGKDAASCLCVSDKILVLGTHDGTLHILDFNGNEVTMQLRKGCVLSIQLIMSRQSACGAMLF